MNGVVLLVVFLVDDMDCMWKILEWFVVEFYGGLWWEVFEKFIMVFKREEKKLL